MVMRRPETVPDPVPVPPYSNKAIIAAIMVLVLVVQRYLQDKTIDVSEEGLTALIGAVGTLGVWGVSNFRKITGKSDGQGMIELVIGVLLILILVFVLLRIM